MKDIKNKTIFITGANSGLGRYISIYFASRGAYLSVIARSRDKLKSLTSKIGKATYFIFQLILK